MYQSARRARNILLPLVILAAFAGMTSLSPSAWPAATHTSSGQQPAPGEIGKEPHHRLLLENSYVRIFAVTIETQNWGKDEAEAALRTLKDNEVDDEYKLDLLHGRQPPLERAEVLAQIPQLRRAQPAR